YRRDSGCSVLDDRNRGGRGSIKRRLGVSRSECLEGAEPDRGASPALMYEIEVGGRVRQVTVSRVDGRFAVTVDGVTWMVDAARVDQHTWSLLIDRGGPKNLESGDWPTEASAARGGPHGVGPAGAHQTPAHSAP